MADLNIGNSSSSVVVNAKHNGSVIPQINNTYDLGTSDLRWKNIYSNLKGNADTATTATNDSAGQQINTTYIKGLSVSGKTITYTKGNGATGTITTQDTNTWRGIQNNLTSTSTTDSLSAAQGKILNETKAVNKTLTNEDLNTVTIPGFYNAGGGNSVINKPSGVEHFGLIVVHNANGTYYTQNIFNDSGEWKRTCTNGTWGSWINVTVQTAVPANAKFTDTLYTHPTTSGNKHIPSGGSAGQILRWSADGTAAWGADNNTTYSANTGIKLNGTTFQHTNSVTAATAQGDASKTLAFGGTFTIPTITYDAQGHITDKGTTTMTMPANPNTDTHWTTGITAGETGTTSNSATTNGNTFIKIKDNSTHRGQIKLVGSGATSVSSNAEGVITISSTDNNTTYGSMSVSEGTTGTATTNRVLTAANLKGIINAHAPTKTGGGASGTWGISVSGNAASASKVNNKLTVGSKSYDGSAAVTIEASDLGLASAMLFLGTTTTAITDGATTNPVTIGDSNKTVTAGNVVLYGSKEFVWTGSAWEELGNEGSYKIVQAAVADPSASGTSNTFIDTISQDANGKITATKKTVAVTNSAPTLAWGATSTIGTVAGTNLQVKMPANPNTDTKVTQTVTTSNAAYPLLLAPNGQTATTTTTSYFDSGVTLNPSTNTIAANISGNAATATKLATARTIQTNLASTSSASFNGSDNITPGVTGTLSVANGGTDATTASAARDNLGAQSKVLYGNSAPSDSIGSNGDMYVALESDDIKKDIVDLIYPVGSIYISMNSTDPSTLFGGTWEAFGQGRVLIGAGTGNDGSTSLSFTAGGTGGEYKHALSVSEMPSHTHTQNAHTHSVGAHSHGLNSHTHSYTKATGVAGHTLTTAEMPSHYHTFGTADRQNNIVTGWADYGLTMRTGSSYDITKETSSAGGGGSHNHDLNTSSANTGAASGSTANSSAFNSGSTTATNQNTGGGSSHNNIMPYISVYFWKRTA